MTAASVGALAAAASALGASVAGAELGGATGAGGAAALGAPAVAAAAAASTAAAASAVLLEGARTGLPGIIAPPVEATETGTDEGAEAGAAAAVNAVRGVGADGVPTQPTAFAEGRAEVPEPSRVGAATATRDAGGPGAGAATLWSGGATEAWASSACGASASSSSGASTGPGTTPAAAAASVESSMARVSDAVHSAASTSVWAARGYFFFLPTMISK